MSNTDLFRPANYPATQGLYSPDQERDACGVGFICNMTGETSHSIIHQAL